MRCNDQHIQEVSDESEKFIGWLLNYGKDKIKEDIIRRNFPAFYWIILWICFHVFPLKMVIDFVLFLLCGPSVSK